MALTDESSGIPATMLVGPASVGNAAPAYPYPVYGGGNGGGNQGFGDGGWWIVLLIIVIAALGGNWGGNGGNGGAFGGQPIIVNDGGNSGYAVQRGFDQAAVMSGLTGIQSGVNGLSAQLCGCCGDIQVSLANGFAGTTAAVTGAQTAISQQLYNNEIASLNRSFAEQTANTAGFNGVQSSLCDIRYGNATNTRDIIDSQNRGTQAVLDKLCQLEIDGVRRELAAEQRENANLRSDLMYARGQASQIEQTAQLRTAGATIANQAIQELRSCPIPAQPVYGNQPIFTCQPSQSCGCGCNGGF